MSIEDKELVPMMDWALALMHQGVIVKLSVTRWRASKKLTYQNLGLCFADEQSREFAEKYVKLGSQTLFPVEVLKEISTVENRARHTLKEYSYDTVWGKFVPYSAFDAWEEQNAIVRNDFMDQARIIGEKYNEMIEAVRREYENMARDVWKRLYPESNEGAPDSFVSNFVSNTIDDIPSREEIIASFKYDASYLIIPMPSFIEADIARAKEIRLDSEMKDFQTDLEKSTKERIANEYVSKKTELIDGFLTSTVTSMRKYVGDLCESVLTSIGKKSQMNDVSLKYLKKLKKMMDKVRLLNFHNDKEISDLLNGLEKEIDKFKGERNKDAIVDKLAEIVDVATKEITPENFNDVIGYLEV